MIRGFPIHPWLTFLFPLVFLSGGLVCLRFRRVSPHMLWLILGFAGLLAPYITIVLGMSQFFLHPGWSRILGLLHPASLAFLIIGLAKVFQDVRILRPAGEGNFDPDWQEVGETP